MESGITVTVQTRNKSIAVSTLHMLLSFSGQCFQSGIRIYIHFVEEFSEVSKLLKTAGRLMWVGYGSSLDVDSFPVALSHSSDCIVFPAVTDTVNWDLFKKNLKTPEPLTQKALEFDTEVDQKIEDGIWRVKRTTPTLFVIRTDSVEKKLRKKGTKFPTTTDSLFEKFSDAQVKCVAYTKANVLVHRHYECIGNIMETASVRWVST